MTRIVPITPELVSDYKAVRLRALKDSPASFGSTFAGESQLTDEQWLTRTTRLVQGRDAGFFAMDDGNYAGLALCFTLPDDPQKAELISMWVAPEYRRRGVGRLLIDTVIAWAIERGIETLVLMVTGVNRAGIEFYRKLGFTETGHTEPYPNDSTILEYEMSRQIS